MHPIRYGVIAIILLTIAITIGVYPGLPDMIPSHWNASGDVDGHLPAFWGVLLIPALMIGFSALLYVLPKFDPLKENYRKFQHYYEGFILVFAGFLAVIQAQILLWGMGFPISPNLIFPILFGVMFIYLGFLLDHAEPNWFVGIRTPWTMTSGEVWKKTHALGGALFKIAGIIAIIGILFGRYALWFCILPILAIAVYLVVYSYLEYELEGRGAE